jgi:hypothetical protein
MQLEKFINQAQSFDLLISTTSSTFSYIIQLCQYFSNKMTHNYSHVALIVKGEDLPSQLDFYKFDKNKLYLVESIMKTHEEAPNIFGNYFNGVQIRKLDTVIHSYLELIEEKKMVKVGWVKMNENSRLLVRNKINNNNFIDSIKKLNNAKYNFNLIDQAYIPFHSLFIIRVLKYISDITKQYFGLKEQKYVCSEIIAEIFKHIGLLKQITNISFVLPEDFLAKDNSCLETCDADKQIDVMYDFHIELETQK